MLKHGHSHHHILQKSGFSIQGSSQVFAADILPVEPVHGEAQGREVSVIQKREHSEADVELMPLQLLCSRLSP